MRELRKLQQQEAVMKKKEAAALAKAEKEAKEKMDAAADEETRAAVTAQYQKDVAAQKAKHAAGRKAQRSKLNERLAKRKAAMANKHKQELEEKAPQAAVVAEQQEEEGGAALPVGGLLRPARRRPCSTRAAEAPVGRRVRGRQLRRRWCFGRRRSRAFARRRATR